VPERENCIAQACQLPLRNREYDLTQMWQTA
jgi:hypothetical protein